MVVGKPTTGQCWHYVLGIRIMRSIGEYGGIRSIEA